MKKKYVLSFVMVVVLTLSAVIPIAASGRSNSGESATATPVSALAAFGVTVDYGSELSRGAAIAIPTVKLTGDSLLVADVALLESLLDLLDGHKSRGFIATNIDGSLIDALESYDLWTVFNEMYDVAVAEIMGEHVQAFQAFQSRTSVWRPTIRETHVSPWPGQEPWQTRSARYPGRNFSWPAVLNYTVGHNYDRLTGGNIFFQLRSQLHSWQPVWWEVGLTLGTSGVIHFHAAYPSALFIENFNRVPVNVTATLIY